MGTYEDCTDRSIHEPNDKGGCKWCNWTAPKTCATCRFMAAERDRMSDEITVAHRSCVRIIHGNFDSDAEKEIATVVDGSGYAARLCVLPTFGCVLHEPAVPQGAAYHSQDA